ncbi:MAG: hypothetical protein AB1634_13095 [Thermodesulfobacteriota bacterium]
MPIILLIFYHGRSTWVHPLDFAGLFDLPATLEQGQRRTLSALRRSIIDVLEARFEAVPAVVLLELDKVEREETLHTLHKRAVVIASLEAFRDLVRRTVAD